MGTRGFVVIKVNNKYYTYYNHYDSSSNRLGRELVDELKEINYEEFKEMIKQLPTSTEKRDWADTVTLEGIIEDEMLYNEVEGAEDDPDDSDYNPIADLYKKNSIEYIWKIDLDRDEFEMYCFWNKFRMLGDLKDMEFTEKVFNMFARRR